MWEEHHNLRVNVALIKISAKGILMATQINILTGRAARVPLKSSEYRDHLMLHLRF